MPGTPRPDSVSTKRQRIAELARKCPDMAFTNLAHHIDITWLRKAYDLTRKDGAVGVDGQTAADYEANLMGNLQDLLNRAKSGTYLAPPVRRVAFPSRARPTRLDHWGYPRPRTKSSSAVLMVLEPVYETDFLDVSHGFRPGRGAHGALASLRQQAMKLGGDWIVDVDLRKFFDTIDHGHLREFLKRRVRDGVILRLIGKWLNAGVLEEGVLTTPEQGTPQGGVISPRCSTQFPATLAKGDGLDTGMTSAVVLRGRRSFHATRSWMDTMLTPWAVEEMKSADLSISGSTARVAQILSDLGQRPTASIPAACGGHKEIRLELTYEQRA